MRSLGNAFIGALGGGKEKEKSASSTSAKYWDKDPTYVCWKLAQPMVDLALVPLHTYLNTPLPTPANSARQIIQ